jgi:L-asparaginase
VHLDYDIRNFIQTKAIQGIRSLSNIPASVYLLKLHPNMSEWAFRVVEQADGIKTVVLETFGAGNAMKSKELVRMLQYCQEKGITVINCTQCAKGSVSMGMYEASNDFK